MENIGEQWQTDLARRVGEAILSRRKTLSLTALALSERCSELGLPIHRTTITKIEKGRSRFDLGELLVLAHALRTSPAALLFGDQLVDGLVELTPGNSVPAYAAVFWFSGELDYADDVQVARDLAVARMDVTHVQEELAQPDSGVTDESLRRALSTARLRASVAKGKGLIVRGDDG